MPDLTEDRLRVFAIVHALKAVGVRVKNWKNFLNGDLNTCNKVNSPMRFAFGRDLHLLPQHQLPEVDGTVPQFLVEACGFLSQHLNTEGLFRKTGSLSRIRTLRADLEQGKPVFLPPHVALLQPCDVASLIKQFLRELPSPLIPADLQTPLIQTQGLGIKHDREEARNRTVLLITALFPALHARALRYFCTFLRQAAERSSETKMDASSLAVVIAPNLLQCPPQPIKLNVDTEKRLEQQTAVVRSLIVHADRIGVVPSCVLELTKASAETNSPTGGAVYTKRTGLSVYRSLRRQRRRSVGEIFVDAFSKLKPSRNPTGPPIVLNIPADSNLTSQTPVTAKRKVSEETLPELEGSAKKRRSLHDLRENESPSSNPSDVTEFGSHLEEKSGTEDSMVNSSKKKNNRRERRKTLRPPGQEQKAHRRKRSLRFFCGSSGSHVAEPPTIPEYTEQCNQVESECCLAMNADVSSKIPLILIDGPAQVVAGNEVDDDPDLLNYSFSKSLNGSMTMRPDVSVIQRQDDEEPGDDDECWTVLEREKFGPECGAIRYFSLKESQDVQENLKARADLEGNSHHDLSQKESKKVKTSSKSRSRPRRSISLPEVSREGRLEKDVGCPETSEMDKSAWPIFASFGVSVDQGFEKKVSSTDVESSKAAIKTAKAQKQDKMADPAPGFKRPHQRLSVTERLRSFSALGMLLRTSRHAPQFDEKPQKTLQRGATRLRRQGARRFGRSISHEGVPERPPDQSPERSTPTTHSFMATCATSPDSGVESVDDLKDLCRRSDNSIAQPIVDTEEDFQRLSGNRDLKSTGDESEPLFKFSKQLNTAELDLHSLFDRNCRIAGDIEEPQCSVPAEVLTLTDVASPVFFPEVAPHVPFDDLNMGRGSPQNHSDDETPLWMDTKPSFEFPPFKSFVSHDGGVSESTTVGEVPCVLSLQTSRRRYRDSPRWPSHEVRMSAWSPLPL